MDIGTLERANAAYNKIKDYEKALNCFECEIDLGTDTIAVFDRKPRLVLDVDDLDGGRENISLPIELSNALVSFLKQEVEKGLENAKRELVNI